MPKKPVKNLVKPSEFRRSYMKELVAELQFQYDVSPTQARNMAAMMVDFLQEKIFHGEKIDLGFAVIAPQTVKAREYQMNLSSTPHKRFFQGESTRYTIRVHKSWQRKRSPAWSRF